AQLGRSATALRIGGAAVTDDPGALVAHAAVDEWLGAFDGYLPELRQARTACGLYLLPRTRMDDGHGVLFRPSIWPHVRQVAVEITRDGSARGVETRRHLSARLPGLTQRAERFDALVLGHVRPDVAHARASSG